MTDKMIILKDLKNCLQNEFPDSAREVILFGPQASGVVTDLSDFDILVVLKKNTQPATKIRYTNSAMILI
jgi:DNA polymerase sigma